MNIGTVKGILSPLHDARTIAEKLREEKKVLVHAYGNPLLKDYIRVSVGSIDTMKIFLNAFFEVDHK